MNQREEAGKMWRPMDFRAGRANVSERRQKGQREIDFARLWRVPKMNTLYVHKTVDRAGGTLQNATQP